MDRAAELQAIFDSLKVQLGEAEGSAAAAIARELRILSAELEVLDAPSEVSLVDELADRRRSGTGAARPPSRRRKSG